MSLELWIVYLVAAIGLSLTPGPNGLLALTHGARFGFLPSIATVLGGAFGFFLLIAVSLAGLGALLTASEVAFTILKWCGAAYLAWLGVQLWRAPATAIAPSAQSGGRGDRRPLRLFGEGFLVAVSNPKALIFFAAFLPQFMVPGAPYLVQLALLGGTFVIIEIIYELMLAGLAHRIAPWLMRHGRLFNRMTGATFIGVGVALAATSR
jgi:threonine/homoserine/homoserine lactone efflux protein